MKNDNLKLITAAEAAAYAANYAAQYESVGEETPAEELAEVEADARLYYKVAGWYLDTHGSFAVSLHKPLGDGSDDVLCGNLEAAVEYAEANPL